MKNISKQIHNIARRLSFALSVVIITTLLTSCAVNELNDEELRNEGLSNEVQILKDYIDTNATTPFDQLVEWNKEKI